MFCPFKFAKPNKIMEAGQCECERSSCALWNEHFGICSLAVDAYLKGQADWRAEKADEKRARQ